MKAFLLAAGVGSRLRPITDTVPKCMVPIDGRPLLDIWLDAFDRAGVDEVTVNLHYLPDVVRQHLDTRAGTPAVRTVFELVPESVALFTFDENLDLYLAKATSFGIDLRPFIRDGVLRPQQVDTAELSPGQFSQLVLNFVEQENARMVIIDSLNGYSKAMQEGKTLDLQLHETLTYLGQLGVVTIMILAQGGFLNELRSPADLTYLADTVIILRHFETEGSIRQAISVAKKRSGGHERTIRELKVTETGLWIGEPLLQFRGVLTGIPVLESGRGGTEDQKTGDKGN